MSRVRIQRNVEKVSVSNGRPSWHAVEHVQVMHALMVRHVIEDGQPLAASETEKHGALPERAVSVELDNNWLKLLHWNVLKHDLQQAPVEPAFSYFFDFPFDPFQLDAMEQIRA